MKRCLRFIANVMAMYSVVTVCLAQTHQPIHTDESRPKWISSTVKNSSAHFIYISDKEEHDERYDRYVYQICNLHKTKGLVFRWKKASLFASPWRPLSPMDCIQSSGLSPRFLRKAVDYKAPIFYTQSGQLTVQTSIHRNCSHYKNCVKREFKHGDSFKTANAFKFSGKDDEVSIQSSIQSSRDKKGTYSVISWNAADDVYIAGISEFEMKIVSAAFGKQGFKTSIANGSKRFSSEALKWYGVKELYGKMIRLISPESSSGKVYALSKNRNFYRVEPLIVLAKRGTRVPLSVFRTSILLPAE